MDYQTARQVNRLGVLEKFAEGHHKRAIRNGDTRRAFRAVRLLEIVNTKMNAILAVEVSAYE